MVLKMASLGLATLFSQYICKLPSQLPIRYVFNCLFLAKQIASWKEACIIFINTKNIQFTSLFGQNLKCFQNLVSKDILNTAYKKWIPYPEVFYYEGLLPTLYYPSSKITFHSYTLCLGDHGSQLLAGTLPN